MVESCGDGGFRYVPDFLASAAADRLLEALLANAGWRSEEIRMFGRQVPVPRLVSWCGEPGSNYRYSGVDHPCTGWLAELEPLRERLATEQGFPSSFVLLNRYRDGRDAMGWHTDDEPGQGAWIGSVSVGAPRRFLVRVRPAGPAIPLVLAHGSLLLMRGVLPHALPRTRRPVGERVNLSFRQLSVAA